jgi:hypothetical protein
VLGHGPQVRRHRDDDGIVETTRSKGRGGGTAAGGLGHHGGRPTASRCGAAYGAGFGALTTMSTFVGRSLVITR